MNLNRHVELYHAPNTRSTGVLTLLEELTAEYSIHSLDFDKKEHKKPEFLALNPLGKVPVIQHGEAVVSEQGAIYLYLADLYADRGLAPQMGDPKRGEYLKWMVFYGSCFEPAIVDRTMQRDPAAYSTSPYGDFDAMFAMLNNQLANAPFMLGEQLSAVDVQWGTALGWTTRFGLVPETAEINAYLERVGNRPAFVRAREIDQRIIEERET